MSPWIDRILKEFPADLSRLWIAADPDDVLLDEQVLSGRCESAVSRYCCLRTRSRSVPSMKIGTAAHGTVVKRHRPRPWCCICVAPTSSICPGTT